jgi:hypothetical protein
MAEAPRDENRVTAMLFKGSDGLTYPATGDENTGRLKVDLSGDSSRTAAEVSLVDTALVVVPATNVQAGFEALDHSLFKEKGTGVNDTYVFVATAGGTVFSPPEVFGEIKSDQAPGYFDIHYLGATDVTVDDLNAESTYVYIDKDTVLQQQTTAPTREDWGRKLFIARIGVDTSTNLIVGFEYLNNPLGNYTNSMRDLYNFLLEQGVPFKKGQVITGRTDNFGFNVSAGELLEFGGTGDIDNPNIKSFDAVANTAYNWMSRTALISSETNILKVWDNGSSFPALPSTTWGGHRVYRFSSGNFAIQAAQKHYADLTLAKAGSLTDTFELNPALLDATFMGWWFIESIASNTGNTQSPPTSAFEPYTLGTQGNSGIALAQALLKGNNLSDLTDASVARSNLGVIASLVDDTTPQLGGELDAGAHSIGFTMQTATGDGTTTVDWKLGNHVDFTFGAFNETFTFTAPTKSGVYTMGLKQDSVGSRIATWPATVKWAGGGTAPTLTTTATTGYDVVAFRFDGTNYYSTASLDFS